MARKLELLATILGLALSLWLIYYGIFRGSLLWVPIGIVIALNGMFNLGGYQRKRVSPRE